MTTPVDSRDAAALQERVGLKPATARWVAAHNTALDEYRAIEEAARAECQRKLAAAREQYEAERGPVPDSPETPARLN